MAEKYTTLSAAMAAGDELAEAEIRYRLLAETFEQMPQLRGNMNGQLERVKAEIIRLRAAKATAKKRPAASTGDDTVVTFDSARFRKSGA
ncbi:hypothetical protein [Gordonia hongkongensis]|uniref:hypothetical protein n=1 Tax=Gordonia hongkongensis TaxID=1701090 RepID=UPI001FFC23DF|nr:hypothetical protein [Gordonia hongkongensis]UPG68794.1 hypothetical protein MVF96_02715 [Gordonia hongkongensis]